MANTQGSGRDDRDAEQHGSQGGGSTAYVERITGERDERDPDGLVTLDQIGETEKLDADRSDADGGSGDGDAPLSHLNPPGNVYGTDG